MDLFRKERENQQRDCNIPKSDMHANPKNDMHANPKSYMRANPKSDMHDI